MFSVYLILNKYGIKCYKICYYGQKQTIIQFCIRQIIDIEVPKQYKYTINVNFTCSTSAPINDYPTILF